MATVGNEDGPGEVRPYDFRCPQRVTAALRQQLAADQSRLAVNLAERMSRQLRTECGVAVGEISEDAARVMLERPNVVAFRISASSGAAFAALFMEPTLAQAFVDGLLGGTVAARDIDREPTDIEIAVLALLAEGITECIDKTLPSYLSGGSGCVYLQPQERADLGERRGIVSSLTVELGETRGGIQLFLGHSVLDRILGRSVDGGADAMDETPGDHHVTADTLARVRLSMTAQFPPERLKIGEVASLQVGDVLHLSRKLSDEVEVRVGDRPAFFGHPGTVGDSLGIQIKRVR